MRPPRVVEHSAVNRSVVGSSPTGGAHKARKFNVYGFYLFLRHAPRGQNRPSAEKSRHLIVNRKMNRNCVAGWVPVCCLMVNFKFYCRAFYFSLKRREMLDCISGREDKGFYGYGYLLGAGILYVRRGGS